jgi:NADPH:quinone reductase-like Zn-dependent oxidoreductase
MGDRMKAIVINGSGPPEVLELREVEKPAPRDNEMLVRVHASTVTIGDAILRKMPRFLMAPLMIPMGFKLKKIAGHELAGVVEAVGKDVRSFRRGDHIFGTTTGLKCGANAGMSASQRRKGMAARNQPMYPQRLPPFPSAG